MPRTIRHLPVLEYLQRQLAGTLADCDGTHMLCPTAISQLLGFRIVAIDVVRTALVGSATPFVVIFQAVIEHSSVRLSDDHTGRSENGIDGRRS